MILLKAFISVDLEGMPYVVIPGHLSLKGSQFKEARKTATKITLATAKELHNSGFKDVIIADSHGSMVNLLVDELPDYVELIRGYPRPTSMVSGITGCDVALFLGYHAKAGTAYSTFDHTYSGASIHQVEVNGVVASEYLLNTYTAGDSKVPIILVAGDHQLLEDDVANHTPWAERVILKRSLGRGAARSYGLGRIEKDLQSAVKRAVIKFNDGKAKPLLAKRPVKMRVTFKSTYFADTAELLPSVTRIDGLNVEYTAETMVAAYKIFELLCLAAAGISAIKQRQT